MAAKYVRTEPVTIRSWLSGHGFIGLVLALGVAMTGAIDYWVGLALVIAGSAWAAREFWTTFHEDARKAALGVGAIFFVCAAFIWHSYTPAPLYVTIGFPAGTYASGENVLGIIWKDTYFPISISVENPTDNVYTTFDAFFPTRNLR
jgi:hypothetical protein